MARSNRDVRYNPRTGLFEGIDITPPSQRSESSSRRNVPPVRTGRNGARSCNCGCLVLVAFFLVSSAVVISGYYMHRRKIHLDGTPKADAQQAQQRQQTRAESPRQLLKANGTHSGKVVGESRSFCTRCRGRRWVCAICKGEDYVSHKCGRCEGSGKKGVVARTGETVGNIITLPFVAVGNVLGGKAEMKVGASAECPRCKGTGYIRLVCNHGGNWVKCPICGN